MLCDFCECDRKILNNERELEITVREWRRKLEWKKGKTEAFNSWRVDVCILEMNEFIKYEVNL